MNAADLVTAVRMAGSLPTADPSFTDARVREELYNALCTLFERPVVSSREGYWRKTHDVTTTAGQSRYRMPARAVAGTAEAVEVFSGSAPNRNTRTKPSYSFQGDQLVFDTEPEPGLTLRYHYYLRPSRITQDQTAGQVTAVAGQVVSVNSLPLNRVTAASIASANRLDILHPNGWFEASVVNQPSTIVSTNLTFAASVDLTQVEVGDYVRAAEQTDWPCLPEDFHRCLADATAIAILVSKGDLAKAQALSSKVQGDLERFTDLLQPRVKDSPAIAVPRYGLSRSRARYGWGPR